MALEAGLELRQFPAYANGSFFHHNRMWCKSVIGRHFIQIWSRVIVTFIMHVHMPNCSKHSSQDLSMQRNKLIHLIILLSSPLAVYWPRSVSSPTRQLFEKIPLCSSLEPHSLASASHFFHTSTIKDCLHRLKSCIPPSPSILVLLPTRRAAPVSRRHQLGICYGRACTKASQPPMLGLLLGMLDRGCHSSIMGQPLMFLQSKLKFRVCARRRLVRYNPSELADTPLS